MGWSIEIYCSSELNKVQITPDAVYAQGYNTFGCMNSAGVYLGCHPHDGLSRYTNLAGAIYVTGRRLSDGRPLEKDALWGVSNFIWDAMDLYDGTLTAPVGPTISRWASNYKQGTWEPRGGNGGVNIYSSDYTNEAKDHRSS